MRRIEIIGGPWPERIGCTGVTVDDPGDGVYPFDKRDTKNVIVLLDNDPLLSHDEGRHSTWSCCIGKRDVRYI